MKKKHIHQKRKYVQLTLWDGAVKRRKHVQKLPSTPEGTLPTRSDKTLLQRRIDQLVEKRKRQSEIVLSEKKIN